MKKLIALVLALGMLLTAAPFVSAVGAPDAEEAPETEAPACAETGAHEVDGWTFAENGTHTGVCALCGEPVTADCVYAEPAAYLSKEDGTHAEVCTVCGGERISPCVFGEPETLLPTQDTAGAVTHACTLCGYIETVEELPPEAQRAQSRPLGEVTGDGEVRADDARAVLRAAVSLEALTPEALAYADMDGDGEILAADARLALRTSVGLESLIRHEYTAEEKIAATCTTAGGMTRTCAYCGETEEIAIPASGHDFEEVTVAATCTKEGSVVKTCKVCKAVVKTVLKAKGHDYEMTVKPASCTANGLITETCKNCGNVKKTEIPAPGHTYTETVTPATCTTDGAAIKTCKVCGHVEKTTLKATGHVWVAATASKAKHCSKCGLAVPGWTAVNGKYYYFNSAGNPVVNQIVDRKYVDGNGVRCDDSVIQLAVNYVLAHGGSGTASQKLYNCFYYMRNTCSYTRIYGSATAANLPQKAANMFRYGTGHCYSYASMFAYIAKVLGYRVRVNCGTILSSSGDGSMAAHGWTEIYIGGGWYMFDVTSARYRGINGYMRTHANFGLPHRSGTLFYLVTSNGAAYWTT